MTAVACVYGSWECNEHYFVKIRKCNETVEYHLPPTEEPNTAYCLGNTLNLGKCIGSINI